MIHILPHLEYSIDSAKSPEDINEILNSVTEPWGISSIFDNRDASFIGEVNPSDFSIANFPRFGFKSDFDFRPVIEGIIRTERGLTVIDIKMRLKLSVLIPFTILFGGCLLDGLFTVFAKGIDGIPMLLCAVAILAFVQVIARPAFYFSAKRAIRRLEELLK